MITSAVALDNKYLIRTNMARLTELLRSNGINAAESAEISFDRFEALDLVKQEEILANISTYLQILSQAAEPEVMPKKEHIEAVRLKAALGAFGLRLSDKNFTNLIKDDYIVEIYSDTGMQIYRNVLFCKLCSYSVLDLAVNPWDELYDKPATVIQKIHDRIGKVLSPEHSTLPFEIDTFVQKEKFIYAKTLRTYVVSPKYITSLESVSSGRKTAFITTFKAEVIAEGQDSAKFRII